MFRENLAEIKKRCVAIQNKYVNAVPSVRVLAVSKAQSPESIVEAVRAGQREFGENYLQELQQKVAYLQDVGLADSVVWHFIGRVQSKKVRDIAMLCDWVHSIDRIIVAEKFSQLRPSSMSPLNLCIQINLDNEENKSGVAPAEAVTFAKAVNHLPNVTLRGLMAIPAPRKDFDAQCQSFARLRKLKSEVAREVSTLDTLSMGMSGDFESAVAEGANIIRIGTALFGPRAK